MSLKRWKQFTPFYFYTSVALVLGIALTVSEPLPITQTLILLTCGFLSWGLVEYVLHRFVFHHEAKSATGRKFVHAAHLSHHENPKDKDDLFAGLKLSLPIASGYWLLAWFALGTWQAASILFIGVLAGYFCYEWLHYQAHHSKPRLAVFRYLKKYHLLHHYRTPEMRFGVTSPFVDVFFGTFKRVSDTSASGSRI